MNRKLMTAILSVLVIIVIAVSLSFFIKSVKESVPSDTPDTSDTSDTENTLPEDNIEVQPSGQESQPESDTKDEQVTDKEEQSQPVTDNKTDSEDKKEEVSDSKPEDKPENKPENEPEDKVENTVLSTIDLSYKTFSLTKDKTALEAYEYLNGFLGTKYSILINKQNKVGSDYEPTDLIVPSGCDYKLERVAGEALVKMLNTAKSDGIYDLVLYSGYRTYSSQKNKFETRTQKYLGQGYSRADAEAKAGEYIAPAGASEHHTGLAADVCSSAIVSKYGYLSDEFDSTKEFKWLKEHCTEYGFILRYTKEDEDITGYSYEPWHFRYIGIEHATACTELQLTYEEYYSLLIKLRDQAKADANV